MKTYGYTKVDLTGGYLFEKQELNRTATIKAVYDRFDETGRIGAFRFEWKEGDDQMPHIFWDSDVAKWMEGAAYILAKHADPELEKKVDDLVALIKKNHSSFRHTILPASPHLLFRHLLIHDPLHKFHYGFGAFFPIKIVIPEFLPIPFHYHIDAVDITLPGKIY